MEAVKNLACVQIWLNGEGIGLRRQEIDGQGKDKIGTIPRPVPEQSVEDQPLQSCSCRGFIAVFSIEIAVPAATLLTCPARDTIIAFMLHGEPR
jgi:hypothetical protein